MIRPTRVHLTPASEESQDAPPKFSIPSGSKPTSSFSSPVANFIPREFIYNTRVFLILLPCITVILYLAGKVSIAFLLCGLIAAYICDSFSIKEGGFISLWLTLLFIFVSLIISSGFLVRHSVFNLFFLFICGLILVITGLWISMQFQWFQELFPAFVLAMERIVMASIFLPTAILFTWVVIVPMGLSSAPYYLLFFLYITYALFLLPLPSSFKPQKEAGPICGRFESFFGTLILLLFPSCFYISIYHRVLFEKPEHISQLLMLLSLSFLLLRSLMSKNPLWWWLSPGNRRGPMPSLDDEGGDSIRWRSVWFGTALSMIVFVGSFEHRIVFHSFGHLIVLDEPWRQIFVTLACYAIVGLFYFHFTTGVKLEQSEIVAAEHARVCHFLGFVGSVSLALVIGLPWYLCMIPAYGSVRAINFYFERKLNDYIWFVLCLNLVSLWYIAFHFWLLPLRPFTLIRFPILVGCIWGLSVLCTFAPSFVLLRQRNPTLFSIFLSTTVIGLTVVESLMFSWKVAGQDTYPPYLIILTSFVGIFITERLEKLKEISEYSGWFIVSLYISKFFILARKDPVVYVAGLSLSLTTLPLVYFYKDGRLSKQRAAFHLATILGSALVFGNLLWAKLLSLVIPEIPSSTQLFGMSLFYVSVIGLYTGARFFSHSSGRGLLSKISVFCILVACLLLFVSPQLSFSSTSASVDRYLHGHASSLLHKSSTKDLNFQESFQTHLPDWLFLISVLLCTVSALNLLSLEKRSALFKLVYCCLCGIAVGLYISFTYVPLDSSSMVLHVSFCSIFVFGFTFIMFIQYPSPYVEELLPFIYGGFLALFPIIYFLSGQVFSYLAVYHVQESLSRSRIVLLGSYAALNAFIALFLNVALSPPAPTVRKVGKKVIVTESPSNKVGVGFGVIGWKNEVGNIATISTLILSLVLNIEYLSGSDSSIFFLSPILLLLNRDRYLLNI